MTDELLRSVWQLYPQLGDSIKGQIMSRYVEHEEPTLFLAEICRRREPGTVLDIGCGAGTDSVFMASQGWDGDQYGVYAKGDATLLAFTSVWDTLSDREEFVSAYTQYAEAKFAQPATRISESELWWETPTQVAVLTWAGNTVLVLLGPDRATAARGLELTRP